MENSGAIRIKLVPQTERTHIFGALHHTIHVIRVYDVFQFAGDIQLTKPNIESDRKQ